MIKRFIIMAIVLAIVVGGLVFFNVYRNQAIKAYFASNKPPPTPIEAVEAKRESVPRRLTGIGTLAAVREVQVSSEVAGKVTRIMFESGARVKAGDPLVQLNDQQEQADLANYKAQAKLAELNLERARDLLKQHATSQQQVDQYQSALDQAHAMIARVQAVIAQKLIRAPFAGQIGIRQVEVGQYVAAGTAIVTLADYSRLYANFSLPEQDRGQLHEGQPVEATVDAYSGRALKGTLTAVDPRVAANTRTVQLQGTLENPDNLPLAGMFANVSVVLPPREGVVTIPVTAIEPTLYGDSVYVVRQTGKDDNGQPVLTADRVVVDTGTQYDGRIAVEKGLSAGDTVVTSGQVKLVPGTRVKIAKTDTLTPPAQTPRE